MSSEGEMRRGRSRGALTFRGDGGAVATETGQVALESKERGFQVGRVVHSITWGKIIKGDESWK